MRFTSHSGAQGLRSAVDLPGISSQSYVTEPPDVLIAETASRWMWAPRTSHPSPAPMGPSYRITASFDHLEKASSVAGDSGVSFELLI